MKHIRRIFDHKLISFLDGGSDSSDKPLVVQNWWHVSPALFPYKDLSMKLPRSECEISKSVDSSLSAIKVRTLLGSLR